MQEYIDNNFKIRLFPNFLNHSDTQSLHEYIIANAKFHHSHFTKKGVLSKRRNKVIYGSIPHYLINYRGQEIRTEVYNWDEMPIIKNIANALKLATGQEYHVCVIQFYNNGEVGIGKHRDKEMKPGTIITSLSIGETRTMRFEEITNTNQPKIIDIPLTNGTLCLIDLPTNDFWLHSIPKDTTIGPRISLIFRNCDGMC